MEETVEYRASKTSTDLRGAILSAVANVLTDENVEAIETEYLRDAERWLRSPETTDEFAKKLTVVVTLRGSMDNIRKVSVSAAAKMPALPLKLTSLGAPAHVQLMLKV